MKWADKVANEVGILPDSFVTYHYLVVMVGNRTIMRRRDSLVAVSYTHLDVYKRQVYFI